MTTKAQLLKSLNISEAMANTLEGWGGQLIVRGRANTIVALISRGMVTPVQLGAEGREHYVTRKGVETVNAIRAHFGSKPLEDAFTVIREFMATETVITDDDRKRAQETREELSGLPPVTKSIPALASAQTDVQAWFCAACGAPRTGDCERCGDTMPNEDNDTCGRVIVQGPEGFDMTPDMSALTDGCYYGCGRPVTGMFCDYVGRTEGVCDLDRSKLGDHITVVPVHPSVWGGGQSDDTEHVTVPTVCVVQNTPGMSGRSHYHAPGCRDIAREMKRFGQRQSDVTEFSFESVAEILSFEYGDVASNEFESNTPEWWGEIVMNAQTDKSLGDSGFGVRIMPCLSIPTGNAGDSPLTLVNGEFRIGDLPAVAETVNDDESYNVEFVERYPHGKGIDGSGTREEFRHGTRVLIISRDEYGTVDQPYMTGVLASTGTRFSAMTVLTDNGDKRSALMGDVELVSNDGPWIDPACGCERHANPLDVPCPDHTDGGFVESMITKEYRLSVMVDENTGATVDLGWVTLTMNRAQQDDYDRVAEEYGRTHGTGKPRHGWASIIKVHDVADI